MAASLWAVVGGKSATVAPLASASRAMAMYDCAVRLIDPDLDLHPVHELAVIELLLDGDQVAAERGRAELSYV